MSSTNRGSERSADDFYSTPAWCTDALLRRVGPLARKRILEPSAGVGAIVRRLVVAGATNVVAIEADCERSDVIQEAPEVRVRMAERRPYVINTRFEAWAHGGQLFDLVVMNPPFSAAQEHIELAISLLAPGGMCCALERLAFGASKKRAPFRARHPYDKLELAQRPSFATGAPIGGSTAAQGSLFGDEPVKLAGEGDTDSADYAWFCFGTWPAGANVPWGDLHQPSRCGGRFMVIEEGP